MLSIEGRVALASFSVYALLTSYQLRILYGDYWSYSYNLAVLASAFIFLLILPYNEIVRRAAMLGTIFGGSFMLTMFLSGPWRIFCLYSMSLSFFHFSEFVLTSMYNPHRLSIDSFLLNHSTEYQIAAVVSWVEFFTGALLFPSYKTMVFLNLLGFVMCLAGEVMRKAAMITAKSNFSHIVQSSRNSGHKLVKHGVYAWSRHPSYVGWFIWSIGTQLLLCTPVCFVGYAIASWRFFKERIFEEEVHLLQFFGEEYVEYMNNVHTGIPFVYGCKPFLK